MNAHTTTHPGGEIRGQLAGANSTVTSVDQPDEADVPKTFQLSQNYPNPFNPSTVIRFDIAREGRVTLRVYNMLGQVVSTLVDGLKRPGSYTATFNAHSIPSGVYFYSLSADGATVQTRKMTLLK